MKNVKYYEFQQCIVKQSAEFEKDIHKVFGNNTYVVYADAGVMVFDTNETEETDDDTCLDISYIRDRLSVYYDCNITSMHFDRTDHISVWMSYTR